MSFLSKRFFIMLSSGAALSTLGYFAYSHRAYLCREGKQIWSRLPLCCQSRSLSSAPGTAALSPQEFKSFRVISNDEVSHNTRRIRFELPDDAQRLGLTVTSCLLVRVPNQQESGQFFIRPYTPISTEEESIKNRHFELMVKGYDNGKVSKHLTNLKVDDLVEMKGPITKLDLISDNRMKGKTNIGMIAGGTGITPMIQAINEILTNNGSLESSALTKDIKFSLLFANQEEKDILCKEYLDQLRHDFADRFSVHYVLDRPPVAWSSSLTGFINKEMVEEFLPSSEDSSTMIFVCGPDPMLRALAGPKNPDKSQGPLGGLLKELGFTEKNVFKF